MHHILVLALTLGAVCLANDQHDLYSDSGVGGPKYETILSEMDRVAKASNGIAQVIEYGVTPQGRPMKMLVASKPGAYVDRPAMVMSGATHGNEFLGFEDRLPEAILTQSQGAQRFLNQGGVYVFIPVLNPDGYAAKKRTNSAGADLNRDWDIVPAGFEGFKQVETKALSEKLAYLKQDMSLRYEITVDYHCCIGALLHPWSYKNEKLPAGDKARHEEVEQLAAKALGIQVGTTNEVLGYAPLGTTKDFYYSTYGTRAFTYEGRRNTEKNYFAQHVDWWDSLSGLAAAAVPSTTLLSLKLERKRFLQKLAD
jgi:hypothetical protein